MADKFKDIAKNGWHPEKSSSSSSSGSGSGVRGKMNGLLGRPLGGSGDSKSSDSSRGAAMPISSLKDPSSFGPPPKHVAAGGAVAPAPPRSSSSVASPGTYSNNRPAATIPSQQPSPAQPYQPQQIQEPPKAPPKPFRVDTSGLSTSHLPPPPTRKDGADGRAAGTGPLGPNYTSRASPTASPSPASPAAGRPGPPSLPPRLPPRAGPRSSAPTPPSQSPDHTGNNNNNTQSSFPAPAPPSASSSYINTSAASRLGAAGVSVPGFGIGNKTPASPQTASSPASAPAGAQGGAGGGTTWAQKQSALRTASQFHKDPSSVSLADARSAAGTANNFRERHGAQVASGLKAANSLNQRFNGAVGGGGSAAGTGANNDEGGGGVAAIAAQKKAPPPPPPKKKPGMLGGGGLAPPPIPTATRPNF